MKHYIGCDPHKKYSIFVGVNEEGKASSAERVGHDKELYRKYLGCLPAVWIPPAELRDQRELSRMRMALAQVRTQYKNRIHAILAKYAISLEDEVSDIFGKKGRLLLNAAIQALPTETQRSIREQLQLLDELTEHLSRTEQHIHQVVAETPAMQLLKSLPGVGDILAIVIALEIGTVDRHLAESAYIMLKYKSPYHEPEIRKAVSSKQG